jgi:hypothetical protein
MKCIIIDNFFERFNVIEESFKKISLYEKEEYIKKFNDIQNWPGKRSNFINIENPFLFNLFLNEFNSKINFNFKKLSVFIHLRTIMDEKKDWIHDDVNAGQYTCLVYLSKTNLNSGTYIYSQDKEIISDIKFVQNRAFFFDARYLHSAYGHHGDDINNGRLTLNAFLTM